MSRHSKERVPRQRSSTKAIATHSQRLRLEIANRAATLIAAEGTTDFAAAKQKAARQMGVTELGALPDNHQIDAALRAYQSIFQRDSQPEECRLLRQAAMEVMRRLDRFTPWLVGAVLDGTANRYSQIELEIIAADAKQLEMFLLDNGAPFKTRVCRMAQSHRSDGPNEISVYEIAYNDFPITVAVYPHHSVRNAHHPRQSLKHARASVADVMSLLDTGDYSLASSAAASKAK